MSQKHYQEDSRRPRRPSDWYEVEDDESLQIKTPWWVSLWARLQRHGKTPWDKFYQFVDKLFALGDHSVLRGPRVVLRISVFMFAVLFLWAAFFHIDQVIHAQGQVIASSRTQIVQAADGGVLTEMLVQEGDEVTEGDVIAVLEKDRAIASYQESLGKVMALKMTVMRLQSEIAEKELYFDEELKKNYPDLVETQLNLYKQRRSGFVEQLKILNDNIRLAQNEYRLNIPLEKSGDVSKSDMMRLQRAINEAKTGVVTARNKYFQDASTELNKAEEDLNAQEQILADRTQLLEHTDIIAPVTGIVKNVKVTTIGGVVRQGDEILQILPTDSALVIEAKVKPADMATMRVGLPAKVKLDAYDYSIFGSMDGEVTYVSPDSLTEESKTGPFSYYRIKVNIGGSELKNVSKGIEIRPGMTTTVDVKNGSRSVLMFLLKPITKTFNESFSER